MIPLLLSPAAKSVACVLAGLALLAGIVFGWRGITHDLEAAGEAKATARAAVAAALATSVAQAEGARRVQAIQGEATNAQVQAETARAAAATAAARAAGLRKQLDAIRDRGAAPADSAPADVCQAERGRAGLLAELLQEADDFAGVASAEADGLRIAGTACERSYGALTP